jgi:hypothetical protein
MAYDRSGRAPDGSLDPKRLFIAKIMHMANIGGGGGSIDLRKRADDLYQTMVTGESHGGWKIKGAKGKESEEDVKVDPGKKIKDTDVDFGMRRRSANLSDVYRPKVTPTMKEGGLVRGAGCAQRGRGRGKMV